MRKVKKVVGKEDVRWTITQEDNSRIEIYWVFGCPNVVVTKFGPRGADQAAALLPISALDELTTLSRNRPELEFDELINPVEELAGDPQSRTFGGPRQ